MKIKQRVYWDGRELCAELHRYAEPANWGIILFDGNERYTTATVNPDRLLGDNLVVINTGDGQELLDIALINAGIIDRQPAGIIQLGFVHAKVFRLLVSTESQGEQE